MCIIFLVSKSCKPKKESFFLSLSMIVTFFVAFTWKIVNQPILPSSLESNFLPLAESHEVDAMLYREIVGSLLYLTHSCPDLSFVVGRVTKTPHESH